MNLVEQAQQLLDTYNASSSKSEKVNLRDKFLALEQQLEEVARLLVLKREPKASSIPLLTVEIVLVGIVVNARIEAPYYCMMEYEFSWDEVEEHL